MANEVTTVGPEDNPADWSVVGHVEHGVELGPAVSGYGVNVPKTTDAVMRAVPTDTDYYEAGRDITG